MGAITPLLDTLLHQIKGRQERLEAYARTYPGTLPIKAVDTFNDIAQSHAPPAGYDASHDAGSRGAKGTSSPFEVLVEDAAQTETSRAPASQAAGGSSLTLSRAAAALNAALDALPLASRPVNLMPLIDQWPTPPHVTLQGWTGEQLQQLVGRSGVFYEAHLAQWQAGRYDLATLQEESRQRQQQSAHASTQAWGDEIVGQQLSLLAGRPLRVLGEAWPAALFTLALYPTHGHDGRQDEPSHAVPVPQDVEGCCDHAVLTVHTQRWGRVEVQVQWRPDGVLISVMEAQDENRHALMAYAPQLATRLAQRNITAEVAFTNRDNAHE